MTTDCQSIESLTTENAALRARVAELEQLIDSAEFTHPSRHSTLSSVVDTAASLNFSEIFDLQTIQDIQDAFAHATGVASIITHPDGQPITRASNFCRLCSEIIRGTPQGLANCMRSDSVIGRPNRNGPTIQPCLSGGLVDGGVSIYVGEHHVANWLIGQVLDGGADETQMMLYADTIGADPQEFRAALAEVNRMPPEHFKQIARAVDLIARQISALATQNYHQNKIIAAREEAERELSIFKALVENAPDGIAFTNLTGEIIYSNTAFEQLFGYQPTIVGRTLASIVAPSDQQRLSEITEHVMREGTLRVQVTYQRADGSLFEAQASALLIRDQAGQPIAFASINRDITAQLVAEQERQVLQEQVIMAQQAILRELSTPLMPIANGVVVMPIIGTIDSIRAQQIMETLLSGIASHNAEIALLDITGVKVVDTQVAAALIQAAQAARMLGAEVVLSGIGPEIAQTLVHIGVDMRTMRTKASLQHGIAYALERHKRR